MKLTRLLSNGLVILTFAVTLLTGCSGGQSPTVPPDRLELTTAAQGSSDRILWGLWDIMISPGTGEVEVVPIRGVNFSCNVVNFLQPPKVPIHMITTELDYGASDIPNGYIEIDITLQHPFPGSILCGHDVQGIVLDNFEAVQLASDAEIFLSMPPDTLLQNPDGYTRWWNQAEFTTYGTLFGYTQGARARGEFTCDKTLNPFIYYSDDTPELGKFDPDPNERGFFSSSDPRINTRRFVLQFEIPGGTPVWEFKYAVTASYAGPHETAVPPYIVEDYPSSANQPEVYWIGFFDNESTAFYINDSNFGGDLDFYIEVRDWQLDTALSTIGDEITGIMVESPTLFDGTVDLDYSLAEAVVGNPTAVRIPGHIANVTPSGLEDQMIVVTVLCANPENYEPQIPGITGFVFPESPLAAYQIVEVPISSTPINTECEGPDESEPNPTCETADPMFTGTAMYGCVQETYDPIDYWEFELPEDGTVDIHLYNDGPGDVDFGYNAWDCEWLGGSGLHGAGQDEFVNDIRLSAGTYFIHVTADNDSGPYEPDRPYHLLVTFIPDPQEAIQFAYSSDKDGDFEVYLTDTIGSFELQLTNDPSDDYMCDFSPDGNIVYFQSDRDGDADIYALDLDTMDLLNVTNDDETQYGCRVTKQNGVWLATVQSWSVIDKDIFRLLSDGSMDKSEWINMTNTPGVYENEMDWDPTDGKIVYYKITPGGNDIWWMDSLAGANQEVLFAGPGDDHGPVYHPDGDHILYFTDVGSSTGLYYYSISDGINQVYYDTPASESGGRFSPDGNLVIFTVNEPGDIYYGSFPIMSAGEPIPVVTGPAHDSWPIWRPDTELDDIGFGRIMGNHCLQVDSEGNPHVFFSRTPGDILGYAIWNGVDWDHLNGTLGTYRSEGIALDADDTPRIIYGSTGYGSLDYAIYTGSGWEDTVIYGTTWPGTDSSIALDSNGLPHLGIHGGGSGGGQGVWHYWNDGAVWNSEHPIGGDQLISPHIEIDSEDYPHIMTHYMYGSSYLWHIYEDESGWTTNNLEISGNQPHSEFDSRGILHCAYATGAGGASVNHIGYFFYDGDSWSTPVTVDDSSDLRGVSLALDSNDYPHISYRDTASSNLKYAGFDGDEWTILTVIDDVQVIGRTSIGILPDDTPVIAYNDGTNGTVECVWVY